MLPIRDPRKAICRGGIFAVSVVLPKKIQHLAYPLETINHFGPDGVLEHSLQVLGCFLVLSVLIWASRSKHQPHALPDQAVAPRPQHQRQETEGVIPPIHSPSRGGSMGATRQHLRRDLSGRSIAH